PAVKAPTPPPAPAALPAPKPVVQTVSISGDALFDTGKAELKPAAQAKLDELVDQLKEVKIESFTVIGHTDSQGSVKYNQRLSEARAHAVKDYLVSKGLKADRIVATGKGESAPTADNRTAAGRAANRRVDIEIDGSRVISIQ
ncbi:MAG TPA: OmpA family protein, partial [Burkholderiaceae bacterium]|nr:OmpA family protein [Burkholderiaceae bacterium]